MTINAFNQGDETAFGDVYDEYYAELRDYAIKILKDREAAKDVVIICFTTAFRMCEQFSSFGKLRKFLYLSVRNACFNELKLTRRREYRERGFFYHLGTSEMPACMDVEAAMRQAEVIKYLHNLLSQLPQRTREVLEAVIAGRTVKEIAIELNIEESSVRSQKRYGCNLLKKMLQNKEIIAAAVSIVLLLLAATF